MVNFNTIDEHIKGGISNKEIWSGWENRLMYSSYIPLSFTPRLPLNQLYHRTSPFIIDYPDLLITGNIRHNTVENDDMVTAMMLACTAMMKDKVNNFGFITLSWDYKTFKFLK